MIGIAITVHNRHETARKTIEAVRKFAPKQPHKIVIIDDASTPPIPEATFRFEFNAGIARAKNKCLDLLSDCTEVFLFDDDCRPIAAGWEREYLKASAGLISLNWARYQDGTATGNNILQSIGGLDSFYRPCGVLIYARRQIWETIGGMDPRFIRWGYEHVEWARRAYNAGLIPAPFLGIKNPFEKIEADDFHTKLEQSTTPKSERQIYIDHNLPIFEQTKQSRQFIPYKTEEEPPVEKIILAAYFTGSADPRTGKRWNPDNINRDTAQLLESINRNAGKKIGLDLITDVSREKIEDRPGLRIHKAELDPKFNPVDFRWIAYREFLLKHPAREVWMIDSRDVEALKDPFENIEPGKIYAGEQYLEKASDKWMDQTAGPIMRNLPDYRFIISRSREKTLINPGIIGGSVETIAPFLTDLNAVLFRLTKRRNPHPIDLACVNYLLRKKYEKQLEHGQQITTRWRQNETKSEAIWRHK